MLRFNDEGGQWRHARPRTSGSFRVARPMTVQIDRTMGADSDISKATEVSSARIDVIEGGEWIQLVN